MFYLWGEGVDKDDNKAIDKFYEAAILGHPGAQNNLGVMYIKIHTNEKQVFELFQKAAITGYPEAQNNLGTLYAGKGVLQDYNEAFKWYMKSAKQGNAQAQYCVALMYYREKNAEEDKNKAFEWFLDAAKNGHVEAQYYVASMYNEGKYVQTDQEESIKWLKNAADQGHPKAQYTLGITYLEYNTLDMKEQAIKYFRQAAEQGIAEAQHNLGTMYSKGDGTPVNKTKAAEWYIKAANQGLAQSVNNLRAMYYNNQYASEDKKSILECLANHQDPVAMNNLGDWYEKSGDYANALYWYDQAYQHDYDFSACSIALINKLGLIDGQKDSDLAKVLFHETAKGNNYMSYFMVGKDLAKQGNDAEAKEYFDKILNISTETEKTYHYWGALGLMCLQGYGVDQDISEAENCLQNLLEIDPDDSLARYCLQKFEKVLSRN